MISKLWASLEGGGDWGIKCITGEARYTKKTKYREASTHTIPKSGLPSSNYHNKKQKQKNNNMQCVKHNRTIKPLILNWCP
jgi:hypothetical protein